MSSILHVKSKSKWKKVKLDPKISTGQDFSDIICVEELRDYDLIRKDDNDLTKRKIEIDSEENRTKNLTKKGKKQKKKKKNETVSKTDVKESEREHGQEKSVRNKKSKSNKKECEKSYSKTEVIELSDEIQKMASEDKSSKTLKSENKNVSPKSSNKNKRKSDLSDFHTQEETSPKKKRKKDEGSATNLSTDMEAWKGLFVPDPVMKALTEDNFKAPTPIQSLTLPHAIRDRLDIVGAAETGSGKTLAFGIPLIHKVLKQREVREMEELNKAARDSDEENIEDDSEEGSFDDDEEVEDDEGRSADENEYLGDEESDEKNDDEFLIDDEIDDEDIEKDSKEDYKIPGKGCVKVIEDADFSDLDRDLLSSMPTLKIPEMSPIALVLEPTRELAVQVKNHLQRAARFTDIKVAPIIGGLSQQKQQRLLKKCPEVIVATPGRLWELLEQGDNYLSQVSDISCLVVDEADRMVEKGHFEELTKLLKHINRDEEKKKKRQTLVFSATLTTIHEGPQRHISKKKKVKLTEEKKLETLMKKIGLKDRPKVIDLTRKLGTVETLTEARINCTAEEKDLYLFYLLKQHPGRTLVFANSKDCIRRLISVFTLLETNPLPLHADMHQKQRLKNLERFTANEKGLLLASDVAARGLDIPNVQHVIHYQVPLTVENYVHRSGRTARAHKEGLSVMLIGQEDMKNYRKIIHSLNRSEDLPSFPVEYQYIPTLKSRVNLARHIDKTEHRHSKQKRQNDWFLKAAQEMDMDIDEDLLLNDLGDSHQQASQKHYLQQLKQELKSLLKQSLAPRTFSGKYPTKTGKLITPLQPDVENDAVKCVKNKKLFEQGNQKRFKSQSKGKKKWRRKKKASNTS